MSMNILRGREDAETLMNEILPFAKRMLKKFGGFHPYGGYMKYDGKIVEVGVDTAPEEMPAGKDLFSILQKSFQELAGENKCKATAIVFDVQIPMSGIDSKTDAVQISLDHSDGYSADVFLPYEKKGAGITFGKVFSQQGHQRIFLK